MTDALAIRDLSHAWGRKTALDGVGFRVARGRFTALLGPNGAGKSTLISVLTGLIRPRPGRVEIGGIDLARAPRAALAQIGVVFQSATYDAELNVLSNLRYFASLQGLDRRTSSRRIDEALDRLDMRERARERVRDLNGGHRRRMEIARALLHRPALLILDEPTVGLDAPARRAITDHVHDLTGHGVSVLWATHLSDEIRDTDQVVLLHQGRLQADGTAGALRAGSALSDWMLRETGAMPC